VDRLAAESGKPLRYHLKIDSGMGRLGTRAGAADILATLAATPHAQLEGLMTHFASAADYNTSQTAEQITYFHEIRDQLYAGGILAAHLHTSSTIAIAYGRREGWHSLGARGPRAIRLHLSSARRCSRAAASSGPRAQPGRLVSSLSKTSPRAPWLAMGGTFRAPRSMRIGIVGRWLRGWHVPPPVESRQGDRRR